MKLRPPLWALPRRLRARHATEIIDLLEASGGTVSDWLDVLWLGLSAHVEDNVRSFGFAICVGVAALSLAAIGYTFAELANGIRDIHEHWWSTGPLASFALSIIAGAWFSRL